MTSIWNIVKNTELEEIDKKKDKEDKKHRSFDDYEKSSREGGSLVDMKSQEEDDQRSIKSELSVKQKDIFAA